MDNTEDCVFFTTASGQTLRLAAFIDVATVLLNNLLYCTHKWLNHPGFPFLSIRQQATDFITDMFRKIQNTSILNGICFKESTHFRISVPLYPL